jgi:hypothetical protein
MKHGVSPARRQVTAHVAAAHHPAQSERLADRRKNFARNEFAGKISG